MERVNGPNEKKGFKRAFFCMQDMMWLSTTTRDSSIKDMYLYKYVVHFELCGALVYVPMPATMTATMTFTIMYVCVYMCVCV